MDVQSSRKAFQQGVYHLFANYMCFGFHQMLIQVGGHQVNTFEQVSSDGHEMSLEWGVCPGSVEFPC